MVTCRGVRSNKRRALALFLGLAMLVGNNPIIPVSVSAQIAPVGAGFTLDVGDLRFIFRQIQIAQAHSAGNPLFGPGPNQVNEIRVPFGLRTVDGSFNHLGPGTETFGSSDKVFPRMTTPVFKAAEDGTSYQQLAGLVRDSKPRLISNLIADQTVNNPAAVAVAGDVEPEPLGTLPIGNVAPDVGLSAPFNSMFTFFGQFFDHGLDLVNKGGNGTVFIPLKPDDPLFNNGPDNVPNSGDETNFMLLTRATVDANHDAINQTTPFVDQNQTYTSHPSHQAFLREYELVGGIPRVTGRLIDGEGGNIGNWAEVKAQALTHLGVILEDRDVFDVPLLVTDPYGHLMRNAEGRPMAMLLNGDAVVLNPNTPIASSLLRKTNHQFLNDIAHHAAPNDGLAPDGDDIISQVINGVVTPAQAAGTYDDELLDIHFVTGDGRGNENIALTAVHQVFHAEHNRLQANIHGLIHNPAFGLTAAEVTAWETTDPASGWTYGERLFQASRFVTEMQYQHLVFEEFARKISPSINAFVGDGLNFVPSINPAIVAEFAHQTYRLGHSMLTETISRTAPDGTEYDIPLLDGFLNPQEFNRGPNGEILPANEAAGAIFQGGTRQVGAEIDEFVTEAVRNRLLGLPLDLAVLNLARGRSEGVAPLNVIRRQLFAQTGDFALEPYRDWFDFSFAIRHPESLVNFIAAYGVHPTLADPALTMAQRRDAAAVLANDFDFLFQSAATSGVDDIDLWIGGLAERPNPFGGLLGSTFNYVFEIQLENLQNADRFYYLERLDGLNLLAQLEANSFAELISRNTTLVSAPADVFGRPDIVFELSAQKLPGEPGCIPVTGGCAIVDDPATADVDEAAELVRMPNGTIRYAGPAHVIFNGRNDGTPDRVMSSEGDDTLRGNGGDDVMEGGAGNDQHIGGAGDDILTDTFGEDVIKGGPGNDAISGGSGPFDLLQGNEGNDFIVAGNDESEVFGGPGNDIIYMGAGLSESIGGSGDDWMEGTTSPASIAIGDDNNQFQNDPNGGSDILIAGLGDTDFDAEGGDDIMVGSVNPTHRFEGMLGFDWATYRGETLPVDADMLITGAIAVNAPLNELRDRFDLTEGLSGSNQDDLLRGDDRDAAALENDGLSGAFPNHHVLTAAGIARISGLAAILPAGATSWGEGNIILGGPGSDLLEGRGGNDILDGDRWLNVQLRGVMPNGDVRLANSLHELKADVFAGRLRVSTLTFVRSIVTTATNGTDVAVFSGPRADYTVTVGGDGTLTVAHLGGTGADGTDTVRNVETLRFADGDVSTTGIANGTAVPNLFGLTEAQARAAITAAGFQVGVVNADTAPRTHPTAAIGSVIDQTPLATSLQGFGTAISFSTSLGALVPDIHEMSVTDGTNALVAGGLVVSGQTSINDPEIPAGFVASTNPPAGEIVPPGSNVILNVSLGPAVAGRIPAVAGLPLADAQDAILAAGFVNAANPTFEVSAAIPAGAVIRTTPAAGLARAAGTVVTSVVSTGADGLALALSFDEATGNPVDSSSTARVATLRQATMVRAAGRFGNAMVFNGTNNWVTVADGAANSPLDLRQSMTIEAWVNPTALNGWETVVMKERAGGLAYALYAHDGAPLAGGVAAPAGYNNTTGVDMPVRGTGAIPLNQWTHLAMTYDGGNQRLYVNGQLVSTTALTGVNTQTNNALRIGGNNSFPGEFFSGMIDEVRVFMTVRTQQQIAQDMNTPINPQ